MIYSDEESEIESEYETYTEVYDCDDFGNEYNDTRYCISGGKIKNIDINELENRQSPVRKRFLIRSNNTPPTEYKSELIIKNINFKEEDEDVKEDVNLTNYLKWTKSSPISISTHENNNFPSLTSEISNKTLTKKSVWKRIDKAQFTKFTLFKQENTNNIITENTEITTVEIPNLYLSNKKKNKYCYFKEKCNNPNCKKAHSLEEFIPINCMYKTQESCNDYNNNCDLKHDDETIEDYLLKRKYINTYMHGKLLKVREKNSKKEIKPKNTKKEISIIENKPKTLSKTRICVHWKNGKCERGDKCNFAHGNDELMVKSCFFGLNCNNPKCQYTHPSREKTKMCSFWLKDGKCRNGDKCKFAHGENELQRIVCRFGQNCNKKDTCIFQH